MNRIAVKIANQDYTITGEEEKDYILSLASHVDEQIRIALEKAPKVNNVTPVILASINIADQYFKQIEKNKELIEQMEDGCFNKDDWDKRNSMLIDEQNESINKLFDRVQQLDNILVEKNKEIFDLQKELEESLEENNQLNELLNQFENDMNELQAELVSYKSQSGKK